jgi:Na+/H+-translocating membrane pyrophosphatase
MMDLGQLVGISVPLTTIFTLAVIALLYVWLRKQDAGTERMQEIAHFIQMGANVFLRREFLTIAPFVAILALLLLVVMPEGNWQIALGFVGGAALSMLAVYMGMNAAVRANVRTTSAARASAARALLIAFRGGGIMGLSIVALNLLGIFVLSLLFGVNPAHPENVHLLSRLQKVLSTFQAAAHASAFSGVIVSKKAATVSSKIFIESYKRLAAMSFLSCSQICSTGLRCEQYLGK